MLHLLQSHLEHLMNIMVLQACVLTNFFFCVYFFFLFSSFLNMSLFGPAS